MTTSQIETSKGKIEYNLIGNGLDELKRQID